MGQQQLLLVILVTVIVGIATVVAINTFSTASEAANRDAVTNDVVAIAAGSQSFYIKPNMLGGGSGSFAYVTFYKMAFADTISADSVSAFNINGRYEILGRTASEFQVKAYPASCDGYAAATAMTTTCTDVTKVIEATVKPNNIEWTQGN